VEETREMIERAVEVEKRLIELQAYVKDAEGQKLLFFKTTAPQFILNQRH